MQRIILKSSNLLFIFFVCLLTGLSGYPFPKATADSPHHLAYNGTCTGDINQDGNLNIFDLLELLKILGTGNHYIHHADLDNSGATDIFDLVSLLGYLATPPALDKDLQFVILSGDKLLTAPSVDFNVTGPTSEIQFSYRIYCNKAVEEVFFVFGSDTLTSLEGATSLSFGSDPISVYQNRSVSAGFFPWYVKLTDTKGSCRDTSGVTEFILWLFLPMPISVFYSIMGLEIDFPLVLNGPSQRFEVALKGVPEEKYEIDLNRAGGETVVFNDIETLARAIMEDLAQFNTTWKNEEFGRLYVSPVLNLIADEYTNSLAFFPWHVYAGLEFLPLDGNEKLLDRLGFTRWVCELPPYIDGGRRFDYEWFGEYSNR